MTTKNKTINGFVELDFHTPFKVKNLLFSMAMSKYRLAPTWFNFIVPADKMDEYVKISKRMVMLNAAILLMSKPKADMFNPSKKNNILSQATSGRNKKFLIFIGDPTTDNEVTSILRSVYDEEYTLCAVTKSGKLKDCSWKGVVNAVFFTTKPIDEMMLGNRMIKVQL